MANQKVSAPAGFKVVSSEEFFSALAKDSALDPMPQRESSFWETRNRQIWGWSWSYGYNNEWIHAIKTR